MHYFIHINKELKMDYNNGIKLVPNSHTSDFRYI